MKKTLGIIAGLILTGASLISCANLDKELKIGDLIPKPEGEICLEQKIRGKILARGFCGDEGELIRAEIYGQNGEVVQNIFYGPDGKAYVDGLKNGEKANGEIDQIY